MWISDNAIFNVNGETIERLEETIKLALNGYKVKSWKMDPDLGLCLYVSVDKGATALFAPIGPKEVASMAFTWLCSEEAKKIKCEGWDSDHDHDGHNERGWRVYTEDWGQVSGHWGGIIVRPCYLWFGK